MTTTQTSFYDLSGGINQAATNTQLGLDLKKFTGLIQKI